jgi:hypothetical protein
MRFPPFEDDGEAAQMAIQSSKLRVLGDGPDPPMPAADESTLQHHRLGLRLQKILGDMEQELTKKHSLDQTRDDDRLLGLIARAKQVQDVLLDRITEDDVQWNV